MEETEELTPDFQKGFNEGYTLAKHQPELAEQLANAVEDESDRSVGFQAGRRQFIVERGRERLPDWLQDRRGPAQEVKPPEQGRDRSLEPDR